jgi:hypothetical protein
VSLVPLENRLSKGFEVQIPGWHPEAEITSWLDRSFVGGG